MPVVSKQIQRLAFPAPVLHDLRGQLDEIPRHAGACQAAHFHAAEQVMQQVSKLVENGLGFAMRQECGLAIDGRSKVAADQAQVWAPFRGILGGGVAGEQRIHPCAAALVLAWEPVAVKRSESCAARGIPDRVALDCRVPSANPGFFLDANTEDAAEDLEHAADYVIE